MRILIGVDGSDNSFEALQALKHLARAEELMLLHVLDVPKPTYPRMVPEVAGELYVEFEKFMKEEGERLLERMRSLLPMNSGPVTTQLVVGSPADVIASTAESVQAAHNWIARTYRRGAVRARKRLPCRAAPGSLPRIGLSMRREIELG